MRALLASGARQRVEARRGLKPPSGPALRSIASPKGVSAELWVDRSAPADADARPRRRRLATAQANGTVGGAVQARRSGDHRRLGARRRAIVRALAKRSDKVASRAASFAARDKLERSRREPRADADDRAKPHAIPLLLHVRAGLEALLLTERRRSQRACGRSWSIAIESRAG
jgi:hypothetical protein